MREKAIRLLARWRRDPLSEVRQKATSYGAVLAGVLLLLTISTADRTVEPGTVADAEPTATAEASAAILPTATVAPTPEAADSGLHPPVASPAPQILEDGEAIPVGERPQLSVRSARPAPDVSASATPAERFIAEVVEAAQHSQRTTGVPASVTIAQAILESDSGRSQLAREGKNFFGIKAKNAPGPAGVVYMNTWEHIGGRNVTVREPFRAYNTMAESFADHGSFLRDSTRYAEAMRNTDDPRRFARLIHQAGYATDPAYSTKLINLMDRYNLYQYDLGR